MPWQLLAHVAEVEPDLAGVWKRWQDERTKMLQRAGGTHRLTNLELSLELSVTSPRMTSGSRRLLRLLALVPDGVARQDLEAVLPKALARAAATLRQVALAYDEGPRLRTLGPVREYVSRAHAPQDDDYRRLATHYFRLAETEGRTMGTTTGKSAVERLVPELNNLAALWLASLDGPLAIQAVAGAGGFAEFMRFTGFGSMSVLEQAAKICARWGDIPRQAFFIWSIGTIDSLRSDYAAAEMWLNESLRLNGQVGDVARQADCVRDLGEIARFHCDYPTAHARFQEALQLSRQVGDVNGYANIISSLGTISIDQSDHAAAKKWFEEALQLFRQVGNLLGEGNCYIGLGTIAGDLLDYANAKSRSEQGLRLSRQVGRHPRPGQWPP